MGNVKSLYRISFPNGKAYLGVAAQPNRRWTQHKVNARAMDLPVYRALRKYRDRASFEILAIGEADYIFDLERKAIEAFKTRVPNGYNVALGGEKSPVEGIGHTEESRQKMSQSRKGTGGTAEHMKRMAAIAASHRQTPQYREVARQAALKRWARERSTP